MPTSMQRRALQIRDMYSQRIAICLRLSRASTRKRTDSHANAHAYVLILTGCQGCLDPGDCSRAHAELSG